MDVLLDGGTLYFSLYESLTAEREKVRKILFQKNTKMAKTYIVNFSDFSLSAVSDSHRP
jgi:hypothetical protein